MGFGPVGRGFDIASVTLSERQVHNPSHDFRREERDRNAEVIRERSEVAVSVDVMCLLGKECQITINGRKLLAFAVVGFEICADDNARGSAKAFGSLESRPEQSERNSAKGHEETDGDQLPGSVSSRRARPPRKEVAIVAAESRKPTRDRSASNELR
jgi:hypothetical protein